MIFLIVFYSNPFQTQSFMRLWMSSLLNFFKGIVEISAAALAPFAKVWHDQARLCNVSEDIRGWKLGWGDSTLLYLNLQQICVMQKENSYI